MASIGLVLFAQKLANRSDYEYMCVGTEMFLALPKTIYTWLKACQELLVQHSSPCTYYRLFINCYSEGDERKLFIGGLSWETKEPQLLEYFSQ